MLLPSLVAHAQCGPEPAPSDIHELYQQHAWQQVVQAAPAQAQRSPDVNFDYGLALAHLQRWPEARAALEEGRRQCPGQKRFPVELAGIAFQARHYAESASWLRRALRLDPHDAYATNFAATVYFLMGNLDAALKYWNRLQKPYIAALDFDPRLQVRRVVLDRSFDFAPASVLKRSQYAATATRLRNLGIFPNYDINLQSRPGGQFDAEFHAIELNGFGNGRLLALVSILSGVPYETVYPRYFNVGRSATNVESLLRWDPEKRRAWVSLSGPWHELPQWRWRYSADGRDENWVIRRSFAGPAPALGALNLQRQVVTASIAGFPHGSLQWSTGVELSHRTYRSVEFGSALTPGLVVSGFQLKHTASISETVLDVPEKRFSVTAGARSEFARMWSEPPRLYEKLQGSALAHWYPQPAGATYEASQRLRAGRTFGQSPFDELFMLGVERDNDLWLRGLIGTRDGRKGSSPLARNYFLSNTDLYRRIYANGLLAIQAGPWFDSGRAAAPNPSLAPRQWLFSAGVEAKLSVFGTSVVVTYGRDLRAGTNAVYATAASQ